MVKNVCKICNRREWHIRGSELILGFFVFLVFNYFSHSAILTLAEATHATLLDMKS